MTAPIAAPDIAANLEDVKAHIAKAASAAGRDPRTVNLVAVSKSHDQAAARAALRAGQRVFGENRVQEAKAKWPELRAEFSDIELHLIGPLQTNKVREAVALFDVIQSVDRLRLAEALAAEFKTAGRAPKLLVQVNTGEEEQKAGIAPQDTLAFVRQCKDELKLPVVGLMCIPPVDEEPAMHFALLVKLAREAGLGELSMGMSGDYETAVKLGATYVRVGTAIFGARV